MAAHELDGDWQFLGDSMSGGALAVVSCFHHPIDSDPSLKELADLPLGWWAERARPGLDPEIRGFAGELRTNKQAAHHQPWAVAGSRTSETTLGETRRRNSAVFMWITSR